MVIIESQIHLDLQMAHKTIKHNSAKNIKGNTRPGKAKNQYFPVLINGTKQTERKATTIPKFEISKTLFKRDRVFSIMIKILKRINFKKMKLKVIINMAQIKLFFL
jgi:hypothetical protein